MTTHFKMNRELAGEAVDRVWAQQRHEKNRTATAKITFTDVKGDEKQVIIHTEKPEDEALLVQALIDLKILFCVCRYS